jgi:hypothetical protein
VDARNHDDARVMLVAVASMARTLMPLLQEAADLSALALRDDDEQEPEPEQEEQRRQTGGSGDSRRHGGADMAPGEEVAAVAEAGAEDAQRRRAQHRRRLQRAADDLCPLADRFGRALTDAAPLLRNFATSLAVADRADTSAAGGGGGALPPEYFPLPEHPSTYSTNEFSLASLLRPRPPSPLPLQAFRQPVSSTTQPMTAFISIAGTVGAHVATARSDVGAFADAVGGRSIRGGGRSSTTGLDTASSSAGLMRGGGGGGADGGSGTGSESFDIHINVVSPILQQRTATPTESLLQRAASSLSAIAAATRGGIDNDGGHGSSSAAHGVDHAARGSDDDNDDDDDEAAGDHRSLSVSTSEVISSWLEAHREERNIELEIEHLRAQLQEREREYERTMATMREIIDGSETAAEDNAPPSQRPIDDVAPVAAPAAAPSSPPTSRSPPLTGRGPPATILNAPTLELPPAPAPLLALSDDDSTVSGTDEGSDTGTALGSASGDAEDDADDGTVSDDVDDLDLDLDLDRETDLMRETDLHALTTEADSESQVSVEASTLLSDGDGEGTATGSDEEEDEDEPRRGRRALGWGAGAPAAARGGAGGVGRPVNPSTARLPPSTAFPAPHSGGGIGSGGGGGDGTSSSRRALFNIPQSVEDVELERTYAMAAAPAQPPGMSDDQESVSSGSITGVAIDAYIAADGPRVEGVEGGEDAKPHAPWRRDTRSDAEFLPRPAWSGGGAEEPSQEKVFDDGSAKQGFKVGYAAELSNFRTLPDDIRASGPSFGAAPGPAEAPITSGNRSNSATHLGGSGSSGSGSGGSGSSGSSSGSSGNDRLADGPSGPHDPHSHHHSSFLQRIRTTISTSLGISNQRLL